MKDIVVHVRRGAHAPHQFVAVAGVRPGRAAKVVERTALDIAAHEGRSGMLARVDIRDTGAIVTVGACRFVVRAHDTKEVNHMARTRSYRTPKGEALATLDHDGSWRVEVIPSNGDWRDGLAVTALRDEAGFKGRDWRVSFFGSDSLPGYTDQFGSLREVAEVAIAVAYERVVVRGIKEEASRQWQAQQEAADAAAEVAGEFPRA